MKLIFATHNEGKIREMKKILAGLDAEILSAEEVGIFEEPVEDGATFTENAYKKAKFVYDKTGEWSVADDSGMCVDALHGAPGIASARWAGENATAEDKANKILEELDGIPAERRGAYFETALVAINPAGEKIEFSGRIYGRITSARLGNLHHQRLPYDAIFIPEGWEKTFAEVTAGEKNAVSQRGQAFRQLKEYLSKKMAEMV